MSNQYYTHGTFPATGSAGSSASMRSELDSISAGFDKLPPLTGNGDEVVVVNSGATALTSKPIGTTAGTIAAGDHTHTAYAPSTSGTSILKGNGTGGFSNAVGGTDYQSPIGTISGVAKGNGANALTAATAGTDYVEPGTATTFTAQQSFTASGVRLKGSSTGYTTFSSANASATAYTITFPAATGTVLTTAAAVTVAQGGTGATTLTGVLKGNGTSAFTAATAGTDYAKPDTTSTWSAYQTHSKAILEAKTAMAANDIDLQASNYFSKTISTTTTLTVSNVPATGTAASFILDLTNGGAATINWWTGVKWAGGTAPTLTAAGRDVLGFFTHDGGTTWTGLLLGKDVK